MTDPRPSVDRATVPRRALPQSPVEAARLSSLGARQVPAPLSIGPHLLQQGEQANGFTPLTLLPLQIVVSVAFLTVVLALRRERPRLSPDNWRAGALGILNPGLAYALGLVRLSRIDASVSVVLWATEPLLIVALAFLILKERIGPRTAVLLAVAMTGVVLIVGTPTGSAPIVGVFLTLAADTLAFLSEIVMPQQYQQIPVEPPRVFEPRHIRPCLRLVPGHNRGVSGCSPVDLASMTDPDDVDQEHSVEDLIDDPVVADAHPVNRILTLHRDAVRRPRVVGQQIQRRPDPLLLATLQCRECPTGSPRQPDLVHRGHDRPRSALTCSHGM